MSGLDLLLADGESTEPSSRGLASRRKFSPDGTGLSAAQGRGLRLAEETGTGRGLRPVADSQSSSDGREVRLGLAAAQALAEGRSSGDFQPTEVVWRDPGLSRLGEELMTSTRKAKVPARGLAAVKRGLRGEDDIDANGVQIAAIQALHSKILMLQEKLRVLQKKGGR